MRSIDGYLSRLVQVADPQAVVTHDSETDYRIESPLGTPSYGLGDTHSAAQQAARVWQRATQVARARGEGGR